MQAAVCVSSTKRDVVVEGPFLQISVMLSCLARIRSKPNHRELQVEFMVSYALCPQLVPSSIACNPQLCWEWWGGKGH